MRCLDSSVIIDLLKDNKKAIERLEAIENGAISTTRINIYEVLFGAFIKKGVDHQKFSERVKAFMDKIKIFELNEIGCVHAAKIKSNLILRGKNIEDTDCLIAGIMLANGCDTIITKNIGHFDRIKDIKIETY
ncbi:type II toxin-antitoxin system VapC family toxin [Candidatus Woesearchaeota archaeon]|nr:type II toxin-antitoxin system VapC family toxin [Candidatus Woesearchaeota archaeon]